MRRLRWASTSHTAVSRSSRIRRFLLRVEELENRTLLDAGLLGALKATPAAGVLTPAYSTSQNPPGYSPGQIRHAYGIDKLSADGTGQAIAIVNAYHNPNLVSDLVAFDQQFGLPGTDTGSVNSFLTRINQFGLSSPLPAVDAGWAGESALDIEWAHAIAPKANLVLVEANSASFGDLLQAISTAAQQPGVVAVSMSWGGNEFSSESSYDSYFTTPAGHGGVTFVASTGDSGSKFGAEWPAASSHVLAVGGTTTTLSSTDTIDSETAWNLTFNRFSGYEGGGGSPSTFVTRPSYQSTYFSDSSDPRTVSNSILNKNKRLTPDVSLDANPNTGYALYFTDPSTGQSGWWTAGGTSAGAPQWAALVALADQGRTAPLDGYTQTLPAIYQMAANATYTTNFNDVTSGSNGYAAGPGYDLATGLGTPKADKVVQFLAQVGATPSVAAKATAASSASTITRRRGRRLVTTTPPVTSVTTPPAGTQNVSTTAALLVSEALLIPAAPVLRVVVIPSTPQRLTSAAPVAAAPGAAAQVSDNQTPTLLSRFVAESGGAGEQAPIPEGKPVAQPPAKDDANVVPPDGPGGQPNMAPMTLLPAEDGSEKGQDANLLPGSSEKILDGAPAFEAVNPTVSTAALTVLLGGMWGTQSWRREEDERRRRKHS
jgi:hypothetical protein